MHILFDILLSNHVFTHGWFVVLECAWCSLDTDRPFHAEPSASPSWPLSSKMIVFPDGEISMATWCTVVTTAVSYMGRSPRAASVRKKNRSPFFIVDFVRPVFKKFFDFGSACQSIQPFWRCRVSQAKNFP